MSISPPSDIVLDVVRAADPARYAEAAARLSRPSAAGAADMFAEALAGSSPSPDTAPAATIRPMPAPPSDAFQDFEAMVLATLIEASMPERLSAVFGSGTAGSIWKSMLAEQLGAEMAQAGGIGIARSLSQDPGVRSAAETMLVTTLERNAVNTARPDQSSGFAAQDNPQ